MPKFAAILTMMYPELPFLDRFEAAAKDGFKAVEYLFPYAFEAKELAARLKNNGLQQVLFNLPPGGSLGEAIAAICLRRGLDGSEGRTALLILELLDRRGFDLRDGRGRGPDRPDRSYTRPGQQGAHADLLRLRHVRLGPLDLVFGLGVRWCTGFLRISHVRTPSLEVWREGPDQS